MNGNTSGRRRPQTIVSPWIVLAIAMLASVALFVVVRDAIESVAHSRFEREASELRHVVRARVRSYADILYGLQALLATQHPVSRLQFHRYVTSLDLQHRYPGYDVVNFAKYVPAEEKNSFIESVRRDTSLDPRGYPDFAIKPEGDRPEYHVMIYVEPMAGFEFAFGLDLGANPAVAGTNTDGLTHLQRAARDSGELTASGRPIRIIKEEREYVGLAMRLAVYKSGMPRKTVSDRRAAYIGSVGAGLNVEDLMKDVLNEEAARRIRFRLFDVGSADSAEDSRGANNRWLLYDSARAARGDVDHRNQDPQETFTRKLPLRIAGRAWEIHASARQDAVMDRIDGLLPWLVLAGGLLSSGLLFGMLYSLTSSRSRALALANEMTKDLRQSEEGLRHSAEQLQALSRRLVDVQETERREFSRELHDRVGQNLTALSINLDILRTQLQGEANQGLRSRLDDAAALLDSTAGSIENVMSELRPPMLDDYGLLPALQWYASEFSRRTGIEVTVGGDERMQRLPQAGEIALFRITQEALTNVAKHAHARSVHIGLEHLGSEVAMSVTDDGVGLDGGSGSTSRRRPGLGMVTMRERTQAVGGSFRIDAAPGGGTRVTVRVPSSNGDQDPHRG